MLQDRNEFISAIQVLDRTYRGRADSIVWRAERLSQRGLYSEARLGTAYGFHSQHLPDHRKGAACQVWVLAVQLGECRVQCFVSELGHSPGCYCSSTCGT